MADVCPLRTQCLRQPPCHGVGRTYDSRVIAELSPEHLALIDAQEILARDAVNLCLRRLGVR